MRERSVTDLSADPIHKEQLFAVTQSSFCCICRSYGNHITKFCNNSNSTRRTSQPRPPLHFQSNSYHNQISDVAFLESTHRDNALRNYIANHYISQDNSALIYPSPYTPRPGSPTNSVSRTLSRTFRMGRGSARESRSHRSVVPRKLSKQTHLTLQSRRGIHASEFTSFVLKAGGYRTDLSKMATFV